MIAGAIASAAHATESHGPFIDLERSPNVNTWGNGRSVVVAIGSDAHEVRVPGHNEVLRPPEHEILVASDCRAGGSSLPSHFPAQPARAWVQIDDHPKESAYTVLHPMHWILLLTGGYEDRFPVSVSIGASERVDTEVVRSQTTYSSAYPELEMALNAQVLLKAIAGGMSFTITAAGPAFALHTTFTPTVHAARAALRMLEQCPAKS